MDVNLHVNGKYSAFMFEREVGVLAKEDKKVAIVTGAAGGLGRMLVRAALDVG